MKKKHKRFFIIISAVFILGLIFAYGSRLIHFYVTEHKGSSSNETSTNYFNDILEKTISFENVKGGLYIDEDTFAYRYETNDNYLWYSGNLWRIIRINKDKTMTLISEEPISLIYSKYEENDYIKDFLNEFYDKLDKEYLTNLNICTDEINDVKNITCNNTVEGNISLLDLYTYNKSGSIKGYLNNKTSYWLNNKNSDGNYWYVTDDGSVSVGSDIPHAIRVMVAIKNEINLVGGNGTKENPYIISNKKVEKLNNSKTGEYITFNDSLWRILNVNENSVQALKVTCILDEEKECLNYKFGNSIEYYNSSVYKYLNNTYLKNLQNNDFIVKDKFYVGNYTDYNFKTISEKSIEAYVGLPKITEYYIKNNLNSYLITPNIIETVYTINELGNYYLENPTTEKNIYPVVNFDINLTIKNGNGTLNNPYELSR